MHLAGNTADGCDAVEWIKSIQERQLAAAVMSGSKQAVVRSTLPVQCGCWCDAASLVIQGRFPVLITACSVLLRLPC
jgi:hypothetical protein